MKADRPLVRTEETYTVRLAGHLRVTASSLAHFTEADVRDYFGLGDDDDVSAELLEEYATESEDVELVWEIEDVDDYDRIRVAAIHRGRVSVVPAAFVPLPGLEGDL